jgi:hypothetical protein
LIGAVRTHAAEHSGALGEVPLPGGLRAAAAVLQDRVAPDRSQFLLEVIRRLHPTPSGPKHEQREAALRALLVHLEFAARPNPAAGAAPVETVPLPLTSSIWVDVVFAGRATPQTLVAEIVRSRGPALLYYGLLSLDEETRAWLGTKPDLIREMAAQYAPGFAVAAPGLRVSRGIVRLPGGDLAVPGWEAVVGKRVTEPVEFVRTLVADRERRLSYFLSSMARLTPQEAAYALNLHLSDASARVDAARRLHGIFARMAPGWDIEERTLWRPAVDPALLVAELPVNAEGRPSVPGTRKFWSLVFGDGDTKPDRGDEIRALADGAPVDFVWLCEQVFGGDQRRRYPAVLFAARAIGPLTVESALDALDAVRALGRYPALVATLERAQIRDARLYAAAARRADRLSAIEEDERAVRGLTQFQGALALLTRASLRGGVTADALPGLLSSLVSVELNPRSEYDGGIVRWLNELLRAGAAGRGTDDGEADSVERALVTLLAGAPPAEQFVEWEGTRYRVDPSYAERARLERLLGTEGRPHLSAAQALIDAADALSADGTSRDNQARAREAIERVAETLDAETRATLQRLVRDAEKRGGARVASSLRTIADALNARGLVEFTYAVALGHPDRATITAADAATRHDFGLHLGVVRRFAPWRFPAAGSGVGVEWHVVGSLLGLDVKLSEFSLISVSSKPPIRRPAIPDEERRVFVEAVALAEPAHLTDEDRDAIVNGIRHGRSRVGAVRSADEASALADEIRLSPWRRTVVMWAATHDRDALAGLLSLRELLALGRVAQPSGASLHAWGAPAEPRLGCLCPELPPPHRTEIAEGRWNAGILASVFPDLNLRLAELLSQLQMPAVLLPGVLAPATLDFVNTAECRDPDDRRGLVDFVRRLRPDRMEQYLALLTSDGPLVPVTTATSEVAR